MTFMSGHPSEKMTRKTAEKIYAKLTGQLRTCEPCALGKERNKNVSKILVEHSSMTGEHLFLDINLPTAKSLGGRHYLLLVIEDMTYYV